MYLIFSIIVFTFLLLWFYQTKECLIISSHIWSSYIHKLKNMQNNKDQMVLLFHPSTYQILSFWIFLRFLIGKIVIYYNLLTMISFKGNFLGKLLLNLLFIPKWTQTIEMRLKMIMSSIFFISSFVRPLPVPELLFKSDGTYRATLWLRNLGPSRRLHN